MADVVLLDGSIGQEIVKRSGDRATPLWSTSVMMEKPGIVGEVHADYFRAGATIATANTYAVHVDRLKRVGLEGEHLRLLDAAMGEAGRARRAHGGGRIAVSLGPLGASYRPDIHLPEAEAEAAFAAIVTHLDARADLFLIETAASIEQARWALLGARAGTRPVWLSVTVTDGDGTRLRSGESIAGVAGLVAEFDPQAVLINCSRPEAMAAGLEIVRTFGKPFGAYANGFTRISEAFLKDAPTVDALERRKDLGADEYADFAIGWVAQGATIVGGCCEVGPAHIEELARRLVAAGHAIV